MRLGLGLIAASSFAAEAVAQARPAPLSSEAALKRLVQGNARYAANRPRVRNVAAGRAARARSQHPIASIIACADSRVPPELVFDQNAGDLFVVRVAGNFVNEDGLASLEYGAAVLDVPLILVLGHSGCGAVAATIDVVKNGRQLPGHLPSLVHAIRPAVLSAQSLAPTDLLAAAVTANVRHNVETLKTAAPVLSDAVARGSLQIVGGVYDLATGKITLV